MLDLEPQKAAAIEADLATIKNRAASMVVTSEEQNSIASLLLGDVKSRLKRLEDIRKDLVGPMNDAVKKLNNKFKLWTEPLEAIEEDVKEAMAVYYVKKEEAARRELEIRLEDQRKAEAEAARVKAAAMAAMEAAKNAKQRAEAEKLAQKAEAAEQLALAPIEVLAPEKSVRTANGLTTAKKAWKFRIIDQALVPDDFKCVDAAKVNRLIGAGTRSISGLEIYEDIEISHKI